MLQPVSSKTAVRPNALLDAAARNKELIDATTPEPVYVDPTLYDPINQNPQPVSDAISALATARTEGNVAANELARQNYNRQIQQLILQNVLGLAGSIGNLGGGQTQTGVNQRVDQNLGTALRLQDQLAQQNIQAAREIPIVQATAELDRARNEQTVQAANEQAARQAKIDLNTAMINAQERARQEGIDVRTAMQQEFANLQRDRQLGVSEVQAAAAQVNAQANLTRALKPDQPSGSGSRRDDLRNNARKLFDDFIGTKARATTAQSQVGTITSANPDNPREAFFNQEAGVGVTKEKFEQQQIQADNLARFSGTIRRIPTEDVGDFLGEALQARDPELVQPIIDELRFRSSRNDPTIREIEAELNAGLPPGQSVSIDNYLDNLEQSIKTGQF